MHFKLSILIIFANLASLYYVECEQVAHDVNRQHFIPLNFMEAISVINEKSKYFENLKENKGGYFHSEGDLNLWPYMKNLITNFTNAETIRAQFPNITVPCLGQVLGFINAFTKKLGWSFQVIDSFGKPTPGILYGSHLWLGEYSECLNIAESEFQGKYCLLHKPSNMSGASFLELFYGICAPSKCTNDDIAQLVNFAIDSIPSNIANLIPLTMNHISADYVTCKTEKTLDTEAIIAIAILTFMFVLIMIGTLFDIYIEYSKYLAAVRREENELVMTDEITENLIHSADLIPSINEQSLTANESFITKLMKNFSFYSNFMKLFKTKTNKNDLDCLHAIRFLSLAWVILGHTFLYGIAVNNNIAIEVSWLSKISFLTVSNAFFSVDTFFLLSGLLTCYLFLIEVDKLPDRRITIKFILKYYFHRIWRLTPLYMIVLMIEITLTSYLGKGPFYPYDGFEYNKCRDTWWTNLLYINNLVKTEEMCFGISWYLANDMQFHLIAPIILVPLAMRRKLIGFLINGVMLCGSILSIGLILNAHPGSENGVLNADPTYMKYVYLAPWSRIGPFLIGISLGFLLYAFKSRTLRFRIHRILSGFGWVLALFLCSIVVFGIHGDYNGKPLSKTAHIFYHCFSRITWGIGVSFMIFMCVTGNGGIINTILSWSIWVPLSRLTYSAYLIHHIVLTRFYATLEHPFYYESSMMVYYFISHLALSYAAALFVSLFFEFPFTGFEKLVLKWRN